MEGVTLIVAGAALIVVGVAFAISKSRGAEAAGIQAFKVNITGQAWLILVALGVGCLALQFWRATDDGNSVKPSVTSIAEPDAASFAADEGADEPFAYGDDGALDALTDLCGQGDMQACDDLYQQSPEGSEYEYFGATCGLRAEDAPPEFCADTSSVDL